MALRPYQYFRLDVSEEEDGREVAGTWRCTFGVVKLPKEHWTRILAFARGIETAGAEALEELAFARLSPAESEADRRLLAGLAAFLARVEATLPLAPPINRAEEVVPFCRNFDRENPPLWEDHGNDELARMCGDVRELVEAALEMERGIEGGFE